MNTTRCISRITALSILAVSGIAIADVGLGDADKSFRDFKSTKSRAEVQAEMKSAGPSSSLNSDRISAEGRDSGVHGVPGSRYSGKTREEVREELIQHQKTYQPNSPGDNIYFGG